jgi:hypothetical protein
MTFTPVRLVSIHGNRVGLNSTGALVTIDKGSTMYRTVVSSSADVVQNSTALLFNQLGVSHQSEVASSVASTLTNYGVQTMSSASATAITGFEMESPVQGVSKVIHIDTSASEITIGGTSTAIIFASTIVTANGSTMFLSAANLAGTVVKLQGRSTAEWIVTGSTTNMTIG